eukprot:TRINITY_DN5041_c0_g1_i11.p1 TRINITY_DN5041_c0_g1~~TRINITY_DN5041_c0_g1_i11.p1  ORF type:complete len:147 (+),score=41.69 TRINITY_DN5041_c0_g1_i11:564-1004(+)
MDRNIVKELMCLKDSQDGIEHVIMKGGDWTSAMYLLYCGLGVLNKTVYELPVHYCCPQITTSTGEKLSKSSMKEGAQKNTLQYSPQRWIAIAKLFTSKPRHFWRNFTQKSFLLFDKRMNAFEQEKAGAGVEDVEEAREHLSSPTHL